MRKVIIHEVGPRDGLQIEKKLVPIEKKIDWITHLTGSGVDLVQVGSFVNLEKVPQMADTDSLCRVVSELGRQPNPVRLSGLVLNEKGLDRALASGVDLICMGASASDTHSMRNTRMSSRDAVRRISDMARRAIGERRDVQASVQSAFGCGFEGAVPQERVLDMVKMYLGTGVRKISLADTAGHASPWQVEDLFGAVMELDPFTELACHFHDTWGMAMANCWAAYRSGVRSFETAFGGLGGCPFTALSGGNVPTEDLVHLFQRNGIREDIAIDIISNVSSDAAEFFDRQLPGFVHRMGVIPVGEGQPVG